MVFLEFLNGGKSSWTHGRVEGTLKVNSWGLDSLDKEWILRAFKRASVSHHFPVRDTFCAKFFVTGPGALGRFECNGIANLALELFKHVFLNYGVLNRESVILHCLLVTKKISLSLIINLSDKVKL